MVGISLECASYGLQLFTSFLSASVVHFVTSQIEGRCGTCGFEDTNPNQYKLNKMPWVVAIQETTKYTVGSPGGQGTSIQKKYKYFTGTLVSKEYVVTSAKLFQQPQPEDYEDNFKVLLGATKRVFTDRDTYGYSLAFGDPDANVLNVYHISIHPSFIKGKVGEGDRGLDVALLQLKTGISHKDHIPNVAGYVYRPICLPLPGEIQEDSLVGTAHETTRMTVKKEAARIIPRYAANVEMFKNAFKTDVTR